MISEQQKTIWQTKLSHLPRVSIKVGGRLEQLPVSADGINWCDRPTGNSFTERPLSLAVKAVLEIFERYSDYEDCDCQSLSSYLLKHLVEAKLHQHVSNGACILAAGLAGFDQSCVKRSISTKIRAPRPLLLELGLPVKAEQRR